MLYQVGDGHGLAHDPFKALVAPRPIAWISTIDGDRRTNLAPFSFFNALSFSPPVVMFSSEKMKHSVRLAEQTGEFVVNLVSRSHAEQMNQTSARVAEGVSEFLLAGLDPLPSLIVAPPRVRGVPAALECKVIDVWRPPAVLSANGGPHVVIGEVVAVFIDDDMLVDGLFSAEKARLIARLGYREYCTVGDRFEMIRPGDENVA